MKSVRIIAASALATACVATLAPAAAAAGGTPPIAAPTPAVARAAAPAADAKIVWVDSKVDRRWPVRSAVKSLDKYTGTKFKFGSCKRGAECIVIREQKKRADWAGVTYVAWPKSKILLNPTQRHSSHAVRRGILVHELAHARGIHKHTSSCRSVMYYSTHCPSGSVAPMKFTKAEKRILHNH
jgi:hypothetical protein